MTQSMCIPLHVVLGAAADVLQVLGVFLIVMGLWAIKS